MAQNDEELDYVSSSPLLNDNKEEVIADEKDMSALARLQQQVRADIKSYSNISRLALGDKVLTIEQQLAVNQCVVSHLETYKALIDAAILKVKEASNV